VGFHKGVGRGRFAVALHSTRLSHLQAASSPRSCCSPSLISA